MDDDFRNEPKCIRPSILQKYLNIWPDTKLFSPIIIIFLMKFLLHISNCFIQVINFFYQCSLREITFLKARVKVL